MLSPSVEVQNLGFPAEVPDIESLAPVGWWRKADASYGGARQLKSGG